MENTKFKIYFHSDEIYFPSDFQYFTENSDLIVNGENLGKKTQVQLASFACQDPNAYLNASDSIKKGNTSLDSSKIPLYYVDSEYEGLKYKTFILFYPYNGEYNLLIAKTGQHWGDIERFTVEYEKDGKINRIYFGAHGDGDGRWVNAADLEMEDGNIVLYSAKSGHGFYPNKGMYLRLFGLANDVTNKGKSLVPTVFIPITFPTSENLEETGLAYFCGKIGKKGISSVIDKGWLYKKEVESNPPSMINSSVYYSAVVLFTIILLLISYKLYSFGFRKSGKDPLFTISFILLLVLILLYIRNIIVKSGE
jgi:hypothetical protein